MIILYIAKIDGRGVREDYLCDMVFHGLRSLLGSNIVDINRNTAMYDDITLQQKNKYYGRGFTIWGTLDSKLMIDRTDIETKIKNKFYDIIIYGHATRTLYLLDQIQKVYSKDKVILLDGEDQPFSSKLSSNKSDIRLLGYPIFKRELVERTSGIFPISFSIPKEKIYYGPTQKIKGIQSSKGMVFTDEEDYYAAYQHSFFGLTAKKGGWDCCRHYEILMNKCIPYFKNIQDIPELTMTHFPKKLVQGAMQSIDFSNIDNNIYLDYQEKLFEHLTKYNTTEAAAKYILDIVGKL